MRCDDSRLFAPMRLQDLVSCLQCVDCEHTLEQPVTLYCGHSICARHLPTSLQPTCPLEGCLSGPVPHRNARDVTLSNILGLLNTDSNRPTGDDDQSPDGPSDSERPRKRARRARSDDEEEDLLSHLRTVSANERLIPADIPLIPSSSTDASTAGLELEGKIIEELTCSTCSQLLFEPLTTPCQHTLCTRCALRCADELACCPLCRASLPNYSYLDRPPNNRCLTATIVRVCPKLYQDRQRAIKAEESIGRSRMPIVHGPLCFPGMPEEVQLTGSKYRLMLRRCYEQRHPMFGDMNPVLGLLMTSRNGDVGGDYGTLVHVVNVETLSNISVNVRFWGFRRFRIMQRGMLDGYEVARYIMIDDYSDDLAAIHLIDDEEGDSNDDDNDDDNDDEVGDASGQEQEGHVQNISIEEASSASTQPSGSPSNTGSNEAPQSPHVAEGSTSTSIAAPPPFPQFPPRVHASQPANEELMQFCRDFIGHLRAGRTPWVAPNAAQLPDMPTDVAMFTFWVAHSLPLPPEQRSKLLPIRSPRLRLLLVTHWIKELNEKWWFRMGCVIC